MLSRTAVNRRFVVVLAATLLALLAGIALANGGSRLVKSAHAQSPGPTTVVYPPTDALFANPERGFYHHTETHSNAYTPLNLLSLQNYRQNENITLILRLFYLDDFVSTDISQTYLDKMAMDFSTLRQAGLKAVVRIAYTNQLHFAPGTTWPPVPPYGDATKTQMLAHLAQLAPVLQANSDVIALAQAGFIGIWGEWYYTDYFVDDPDDPGTVSAAKYAERGEVLSAILNALPGRMVQVRTPLLKQKIYGTGTGAGNALPPADAFNGTNIARTGHHNDCFLASDSDFGTYSDITGDKAYLGEETKYLPMGGETCNPNPPRSECPMALSEMALFHWSYLNTDYHPGVLGSWATGNCLDTVKRRLGYRLALIEGRYPDTAQAGSNLAIEIDLRNEGWAAPFNPRPVELVLRHQTTLAVHRFPLAVDPRFWLADGGGNHSLVQSIPIPANLPVGAYDLLLSLPDPSPVLATRAEYAIRLANENVWEASSGLNQLLHTVTIQPPDIMLPLITASAAKADSSLYTAGVWTNQTVTVHFTCTDADSGVASCTGDQVFDVDSVTASVNGTATDNAGNSANASFGPVQIDKTVPDTAITGQPTNPSPSADASFAFNGSDGMSGVAGFECSLNGAGFVPCVSPQDYTGLANTSHTFQVRGVDTAGNMDATPASATWTVQTLPPSVTVTIKVAEPSGVGRAGYVVRVYAAGGAELTNAVTDGNGLTTFPVTPGANYEYTVGRYGALSTKIGFQLSADQTLTYTLAQITVNVGRPNYTVRIFNGTNGSGVDLTSASTDANGNTSFYLIEGDYGYQVERYGSISAKAGFTVVRSTAQTITYTLAKVTVNVGRPGYTVRFFSGTNGNGLELGSASSDTNGNASFYLIEGDYGYQVERYGIYSAKAGFTVVRSTDQTIIYTLAKVTVNVGRPNYTVRFFSGTNGNGLELGSAKSDAEGNASFYLIEGDYGYQVERYGIYSAKAGFTVVRSTNQTLSYTLAQITVNVGRPNYIVRIFSGTNGSGVDLTSAKSDANGDTNFYLIEGDYGYQVEKYSIVSAKAGFTVARSAAQTLTYSLAQITVNVGRPNYIVRIFSGTNGSGVDLTSAKSDANGDTNFYLIEGDYGYQVEKYSIVSAKAGFTVARSAAQTLTYSLAQITVNVGRPNYIVRIFSGANGSGVDLTSAKSDANGDTNFYLIEGGYGFLVEKNGARSAIVPFTVVRSTNQILSYTLAQITLNVTNSGGQPLPNYTVRIFIGTDGSGPLWGSVKSDASGNALFYLVEGGYQYQVEKNAYNSGKQPPGGFVVVQGVDAPLSHVVP